MERDGWESVKGVEACRVREREGDARGAGGGGGVQSGRESPLTLMACLVGRGKKQQKKTRRQQQQQLCGEGDRVLGSALVPRLAIAPRGDLVPTRRRR